MAYGESRKLLVTSQIPALRCIRRLGAICLSYFIASIYDPKGSVQSHNMSVLSPRDNCANRIGFSLFRTERQTAPEPPCATPSSFSSGGMNRR